jgi:orotate phosphoribosyltransferase
VIVGSHLQAFRDAEALLEGHFQLSSGLHSTQYIQCARVLMSPKVAEGLCSDLRARWTGETPDLIVGPALGGVVVGYELARAFGVPGIFAERENGKFAIRRGFTINPGQKIIVAEDVVTTGGSAAEVVDLVTRLGGRVVGVMCLVQRTERNPFAVPFASLETLIPPTWAPAQCPLCLAGGTAVEPGSRPGAATSPTA